MRYQLSRKAKKETPVIVELLGEGKFEKVSYRIPPQGMGFVKDYEDFESRMLVLKQIVETLKDAGVYLVGVYGMSGVGKTTLTKKLAAQVKEYGIFKMVVQVVVTHTPDVKRIQQEIADWLDFKFDVESIEVRAARLCARLKQEEKILVILDDMWERIKLEEIGIPFFNDHKGCKILMTSRNQNVLWEMGVQRDFRLQVLEDKEAWHFFEKKAGNVKDPNLQPIAIEVARRCAGLPVLIVAVGMALKNKEFFEWNDALEELKRFDNEGMEGRVYSALELSYNFLGGEEKSVFLLCGQLKPQGESISDLLKYSIGLRLFNQRMTLKATRNRLLKVVNDLKRCCLLLEGDNNEYVSMHDVVHRFASSIASKYHHVFTVAYDTVLEEWPEKHRLEQCTSVSLPYCKIPQLPEVFECPKLKSFFLFNNNPSLRIPDNFFNTMIELKLLDLTSLHFSGLPMSLRFLENLQTLCLDGCVLEDTAIIGDLKSLKVLSFVGSNIVLLPREIGRLTRLQLLDLRDCSSLEVIPPNVLSCLTQLEDLHMGNSFVQWEGEGHNGQRNNANLSELKLLSNLITLDMHVIDAKILPKDFFLEKLERFRIFIGDVWGWSHDEYETSKKLKLKLNMSIHLVEGIEVLLKRTEDLHLDELKGVKNVLYELDGQGFPLLKRLHVQNNLDIQYIIDSVRMGLYIAFPSLESLFLDNLNDLEKICHGPLTMDSFSNLRMLKVGNCNRLENLFSSLMVNNLVQLEEINVSSCRIMKEIVVVVESEDNASEGKAIMLTKLRTLTLEYLPQFISFCSQVKQPSISQSKQKLLTTHVGSKEIILEEELETPSLLFNEKISFPNLLDLKLSSIKVKKLLVELLPCSQNLTTLIVDDCGDLNYLFTSSMVKSLAQLKRLEICDCKSMEETIVTKRSGEERMMNKVSFLKLDFLKLKGLPKLVRFCSANLIECPALKVLQIENCPQLKTFISNSINTNLAASTSSGHANSTLFDEKVALCNLEELHIRYMHKLKMIWHNELHVDSFHTLKILKIDRCMELLKIFPANMLRRVHDLEHLDIKNCDSLEEVFHLHVLMKAKGKHVPIVTQLRTLNIRNLPFLRHVWSEDPQGILSFHNLSSVFVWNCPILKSIFPASIARDVPQLIDLNIAGCGLKEIVAKEEGVEASPRFVFPQLKFLDLWNLRELKSFYSGIHTLECPVLECLRVVQCDKLEIFASESQNLHPIHIESQLEIPVQLPLFPFKKVLRNLEILTLNSKDAKIIHQGQFPADYFHRIKFLLLQFFNDDSADFPFDFLGRFQKLETLVIGSCYFKELFPSGLVEEKLARSLAQIRYLRLDFLPNIKYIWNQDCQPGQFLPNLEDLQIWKCHSLIDLAPSCVSFQNLKFLDVNNCRGLIYLITSSTAKNLTCLTKISVRESSMIREVVATERDEPETEIVFSKLEILRLYCLTSLTSFSSASCTIKFPSLEEVIVIQCPKMKMFSQGVLSAPKLKRVCLTEERDKWRWVGDLNSTIQLLYADMVGFNGLHHLKLSEFHELKEIWHGQLPGNFFYNLSSLVVDECEFSSSAVPSNLLPYLNDLKALEVRNCHSVEEVFGLECLNASGHIGLLSALNKLHLIDLPRLRHVWNEVCNGFLDFSNLKSLKIYNCSSLRNIFTSTMSLSLVQLQEIEVRSCLMVKEIITEGVAREGSMDNIIFPQLNSVTLKALPSLSSFYSGSGIVHCPSLKEITIVSCPRIFTSTFFRERESNTNNETTGPKVVFPNLKDLKLSSVDIVKLWKDQVSSCFQNLTTLIVDGCANLKYLMSSSMFKSLVHLKQLEICNCKVIEEIIAMEGLEEERMSEMLLYELDFLKLKDLPKLTGFCTSNLIECPALKELWIQNCPELRTFISNSASTNMVSSNELQIIKSTLFDEKVAFPNLERMRIFNMDNLKMIWHNELHLDSFCKLKVLMVEHGRELVKIFPSNILRRIQSLEDLVIRNCDSLEEVFDLQDLMNVNETVTNQLRTLDIQNLPNLKNVWDKNSLVILSFRSLCSVCACNCPSLKNLFPASVARGLSQLETLFIDDCGLKEIIVKEEGGEEAPMFLFPQLKFLKLWRSKELKCFYPGPHVLECPMLETLRVYECDNFEIFSSEQENIQEMHRMEGQLEIQAPQPLLRQFLTPNLEHLSLMSKDVATIMQGQFLGDLFHIKVLELNCFHDKSAVFPFDLLQRFLRMEKLAVGCSQFKELFPYEGFVGEEKYERTLAQIRCMELDYLPDLKHIWNQDSHLGQVLQTLETLEVWNCDSLINIAPSSASFHNLKTLDVKKCKELICLLTSSTAKSLVQLTRMSVAECDMMREIVVNDEDESKDEITFSKLENLELYCLPSLVSFSSAEHSFKFPSLTEVKIGQCPKMEVFSEGVLSTPKLQRVQLTGEEDKGRWNGDLNATIQHLFAELVGFCGLQHLKLSEFHKLRDMWHGEIPVELFSDLRSLVVDECASFSNAISSHLLFGLNNLEELNITYCVLLEEVFDIDVPLTNQGHSGLLSKLNGFHLIDLPKLRHVFNKHVQGILNLKNLKFLEIDNCSSLRNIFTPSMALGLVQLQEIEVKNCDSVEEIITKGAEDAVVDNIIFPKLNSFVLESLPNLTSFYSGTGVLEFPSLEKVTLVGCPKMETFAYTEQELDLADEGNEDLGVTITPVLPCKVLFPSLKDLNLSSFKIDEIWHDHHLEKSFSIQNLTSLIIDGCDNLNFLLSSSMVKSLVQLKKLEICDCKMLAEIIVMQGLGGEEKMTEMLLSKLDFLKLSNLPELIRFSTCNLIECPALKELWIESCPKMRTFVSNSGSATMAVTSDPELMNSALFDEKELKSFYPGIHTLECPVLESLRVYQCDKLETFSSECQSLQETPTDSQLKIQIPQPLFSFKIILNLKHISFTNKDAKMILEGQFPAYLFQNLKMITLHFFLDESAVFPFELLQIFQKMEKLVVYYCQFKELFPYEGHVDDKKHMTTLPQIWQLQLTYLPVLKHIWNQDSQLDRVLQTLEVRRCDSLITLAPSSASFKNLMILDVMECHRLVSLLTPSTAKSLVQLTRMSIKECYMVKEIVANEGDEPKEEIVFRKLESLELRRLPSLVSFCSAEHSFRFPSLTEVIVTQCPKMQIFSKGLLRTPWLWTIKLPGQMDQRFWYGNLNTTIQKLFTEMNA